MKVIFKPILNLFDCFAIVGSVWLMNNLHLSIGIIAFVVLILMSISLENKYYHQPLPRD